MKPQERLKEIEHQMIRFEITRAGKSFITEDSARWLVSRVKQLEECLESLKFQMKKNSGYKCDWQDEIEEALEMQIRSGSEQK